MARPLQTLTDAASTSDGRSADEALLRTAAEMMLEFNVRSAFLSAQLQRLADFMGMSIQTSVTYRDVAICFDDGRCVHVRTPEYRLNDTASIGVMRLVDRVCAGTIAPGVAVTRMRELREAGGVHGVWPLAGLFGFAAAALACILRADLGAILVVGISSALGLLARKVLGRRHWPLFSLPFVAALIGGIAGGWAARSNWTQTAGLCLIVPALMLVPGPHLINGVADVFENHIQTGVCRLVLAAGILLAAAAGVFAGGGLVANLHDVSSAASDAAPLTLGLDVVLAGVAAAGFGAFYNSPWRVLWISIVCGMIGHGVRFVCLDRGAGLPESTFLACVTIGLLASASGDRLRLPLSSVAFAAAVPMMPGSLIYRSIAAAARLAVPGSHVDPADATASLVLALQAALVVGAMAVGLLAGAATTSAIRAILHRGKTFVQ